MSIKKPSLQESPKAAQRMPSRRILITIAAVLSLLAGGAALALRGGSEPQTTGKEIQMTPAGLTPAGPSKEYIYAGGRLIATEEPAGSTCSYLLTPTSQAFASNGGPGTVGVTAAVGCTWAATSNDTWITINTGTPGSGNGSVGYTVSVNNGVARNGSMTIAGQSFPVTQAAAGCSYVLSPTSQSFAAGGGPGTVGVTAGAGCGWTASSNAAWITVNTGTPGSGNGSVGYTVASNSGVARNSSMTIAGLNFPVTQAAGGGGGTAPSLIGMSPITAIQGASFTLTITGSNLAGTTSINLTPPDDVTFTNISSTAGQITCTMSIGAAAAVGGRNLKVTTASGGLSTNALSFGILSSSPAPTISSISHGKQPRGVTFTMTINGTNLLQTSSMNFTPSAGITVSNLIVVSSVKVTATVSISSGAATGIRQVSVTTPSGTSNTKNFTVQ